MEDSIKRLVKYTLIGYIGVVVSVPVAIVLVLLQASLEDVLFMPVIVVGWSVLFTSVLLITLARRRMFTKFWEVLADKWNDWRARWTAFLDWQTRRGH